MRLKTLLRLSSSADNSRCFNVLVGQLRIENGHDARLKD